MKYYISDTPLKLREFGRNVQSMIEYAKTIEDKEKRTKIAHQIIRIMIDLNPSLKENADYEQKLWDALHVMADFELDVEAPFEVPDPEIVNKHKSEHMGYYRQRPRYRQYGKSVELMIQKAMTFEEGPKRTAYINMIASTMKQFLRNANKENTPDEVIAEHIRELSSNEINVKAEDLVFHRIIGGGGSQPNNTNRSTQPRRKNKSKNNNKSRKRKRSNHNNK